MRKPYEKAKCYGVVAIQINLLFEQNNNHIDFTVVATGIPICNPLPVSPAPREFYELGQLQEGNYTM